VHVGAAILAELVGPSGAVTAIEFHQGLAKCAATNLSGSLNVRVAQDDGASMPLDPADIIYVNAGATGPAPSWLDGLNEGGRLILPLTTNEGFRRNEPGNIRRRGAVFRIERRVTISSPDESLG
jgi:protein-L-isoaspartate(D-aspartate) O-methyltransferase